MNRYLIGTASVIATVVVVFGGKAVSSHVRTLRQEVRETVRENTPGGHEARRIQTLIQDASRNVLAFADKMSDIEGTAATQRGDVQKLEQELAADRTDLLAERNLLAQTGIEFQIRGTRYTRAQIEASAQARLARIQRDQSTIDAKKQSIERLEAAIGEGRNRLQAAVSARDQRIQELEVLSAELANAELQRDLASLSEPLRNGAGLASTGTELAESMKAFAARVRTIKRQADTSGEVSSAPALIPHNDTTAAAGLVEQIDRILTPTVRSATALTNALIDLGKP